EPLFLPLVLSRLSYGSGRSPVWEERNPIFVAEGTFDTLSPRSGAFRGLEPAALRRCRGPVRESSSASAEGRCQLLRALGERRPVRPCREQAAGHRDQRLTCTFTEDIGDLRRSGALGPDAGGEERDRGRGGVQAEAAVGVADGRADDQADARPLPRRGAADPLGV